MRMMRIMRIIGIKIKKRRTKKGEGKKEDIKDNEKEREAQDKVESGCCLVQVNIFFNYFNLIIVFKVLFFGL